MRKQEAVENANKDLLSPRKASSGLRVGPTVTLIRQPARIQRAEPRERTPLVKIVARLLPQTTNLLALNLSDMENVNGFIFSCAEVAEI